jgi:hypothetical protein
MTDGFRSSTTANEEQCELCYLLVGGSGYTLLQLENGTMT